MFVADATLTAAAVFVDRGGNRSRMTVRYPFSLDADTAFAAFSSLLDAALVLSNAMVERVTITWSWREVDLAEAAEGSDVTRKLALYYSNEGVYDAFWVPSPEETLFETSGTYSGIRVAAADPDVALVLVPFVASFIQSVTPDLADWGEYVVGGLAL